jgi:hypothetical protein
VPGAGIEPARLAAPDFESHHEMRLGVACSLIRFAKNLKIVEFFAGAKVFVKRF